MTGPATLSRTEDNPFDLTLADLIVTDVDTAQGMLSLVMKVPSAAVKAKLSLPAKSAAGA